MKVGLMIEAQEGAGWAEWKTLVGLAEDLGFESLWRSDHFCSLAGNQDASSIDPFIAFSYVSTATRRIRFGPLVTAVPFRHPVVLARMAVALDELSEGRFELGLGAGWYAPEFEMFGFDLLPPAERIAALEEGVGIVKDLTRGRFTTTLGGRHYQLRSAIIRPARAVPIVIGGGGEKRTLRVVARHADEWNLPAIARARYEQKCDVLRKHCEAEGRDVAGIRKSMVFTTVVRSSAKDAKEVAAQMASAIPPEYRPGSGPDAPVWLVGDGPMVVEQLREYEIGGLLDRAMIQFRDLPTREELHLVADSVLTSFG